MKFAIIAFIMKSLYTRTYKFLRLFFFSILFVVAQVDASQVITYTCGRQGCQINNEVKYTAAPEKLKAQILTVIKKPIQSLVDKKINQISGMFLQRILDEVSSVDFKIISEGYVAPQGRMDGFMYKVEERIVYGHVEAFKEIFSSNEVKLIEGILLHETLGALGYIDDDYQISSTLMALDILTEEEIASSLVKVSKIDLNWNKRARSPSGILREIFETHTRKVLIAGGSTTAGGGGDPIMALAKTKLIAYALKKAESLKMLNSIINYLRLERPLGHEEFQKNELIAIRSYPLEYENFLLSIKSVPDSNRLNVLLGVEGYFTPLLNIEMHLLNYLKKNNFIGGFVENKK